MRSDEARKARPGPGRPRSAAAHRAVLRATLELFGDSGFHGLTFEGVAARAGVARTTVYRWWPSKLALLLEALAALWQQAVVPDTGSVREDSVAHLRGFIELHEDRRVARMLATLLAEASRYPELLDARPVFVAAQREPLRQALERGVARGELPAGLEYELTMDLLMSPITMRALATGGALEPGLAERIVDSVLDGLRATGSVIAAPPLDHSEARAVASRGRLEMSWPRVELLWFEDCPNHPAARVLLDELLGKLAPGTAVHEIDASDPAVAERHRFPGSPTIRIDGRDVDPSYQDPGDYTPRCRLYRTADGLRGLPERGWVESAIRASLDRAGRPS